MLWNRRCRIVDTRGMNDMVKNPIEVRNGWTLPGLAADGPDPKWREQLMVFGQFVGDWTIDARYPQSDGSSRTGHGSLHMRWILEGRAVQDIWTSETGDPPREVPIGTTLRFYDPKIDAWRVVWISPRQDLARTFVARKIRDEIVLEGMTSDGEPEHWIFSEIIPRSFRWRSVESQDGGKSWRLTEEMRIRRAGDPSPATHS